jgi:pilus assembly protein CpaE
VFTLRRAHVLNHNAPRNPGQQQAAPARSGGEGRVITVFSPKGGVGKSTMATGLAGAYAGPLKRHTLLIDLDLQFGDVGIMMGIDPTQTIVDLVTTTGELDPDKLGGYVVHHPSGVDVLAAPLRPEDAELVTEDRIGQLIDVAKAAYDIVVLDTPPHFDATTLAALDRSDRLVLLTTMDIPTVKNAKLALQTLNLLQYPRERIALVINRPLPRTDLRESDISRTLDMPVTAVIPGDKEIGAAVNRGVPITASNSRSPAAKAIKELAELLLPGAQSVAESKSSGEGKASKPRPADKQPSAGRHSLFKAGVSKLSKSKDKKAA